MSSRTTGIVHGPRFKDHFPGENHPESPARIDAVGRAIAAPSVAAACKLLPQRAAEREEILLVHSDRHFEEIEATAKQPRVFLDSDTVTSPASAEVARLAVGSVLATVDAVMDRQVANGFAFVRPPGHHAKPDKAMGFCLYNNVAVAAVYASRRHGLKRVLIVDFDLHHGNGTQKAFYTSPEVLYVSTHQWPHYPGTGTLEETGKDAGEGFTLNLPLPAGTGDYEYRELFRQVIVPVGSEYRPELVLVSAGFDAYVEDPLGSMALTHLGYAAMAGQILELAEKHCAGRAVFVLEGGYHLPGLQKSALAVLEVMTGVSEGGEEIEPGRSVAPLVDAVRQVHGRFWSCLR
jgi:acetoin utilization deacetylase AcuC-like enzyme